MRGAAWHARSVLGLWLVLGAGCASERFWAPADPIRPLLRPGLAGCVAESSVESVEGDFVRTVYDGLGRPSSVVDDGGTTPWSDVEETFRWDGDCLVASDAAWEFNDGTGGWREVRQRCDAAGFPVWIEARRGDTDEQGVRELRGVEERTYTNAYRGGQLATVVDENFEIPVTTTYTWEGDQLVEAVQSSRGDVQFVQTWTWRAGRLVESRESYPRTEGAVAQGWDHHWRGGRYRGYTQLENGEPVAELTYLFHGGPLPVASEWRNLQGELGEVTTWSFDCE